MQFNRSCLRSGALIASVLALLSITGCISGPTEVRMEPKSAAKRLGVGGCRVSIPLSQTELIADARKVGNPNPEDDPQWIKLISSLQPGDQLRVINCLNTRRMTYYYALIRNDSILMEFHSSMFD